MNGLHEVTLQCPCCWESIVVLVDPSVEIQEYTEDCSVCCRPLTLTVRVRGGKPVSVEVRAEND